jgi:hypothetical protein
LERQVAALESKIGQVLELLKDSSKPTKASAKPAPSTEAEITEPLTDISPKARKPKKEVVKKVVKKAAKKATKKSK